MLLSFVKFQVKPINCDGISENSAVTLNFLKLANYNSHVVCEKSEQSSFETV